MSEAGRVQRETALRAAVLAGDVRAWQAWCADAFAAVHAYALWRCGGRNDLADDVVQESWMIAIRRISQFDPRRASFVAWLRGIAVNVLRNQLRQWRRRPPTISLNGAIPHPGADLERAERITAALAALPDHYESVLRAKYLDGCTVEQIAAERRETLKAVESLLSRARQAFRDAFGEE